MPELMKRLLVAAIPFLFLVMVAAPDMALAQAQPQAPAAQAARSARSPATAARFR
jgi:hypothetical protein